MSMTISEEFKRYVDFSVRVDRFFNIVNIYGMHHNGLKTIYSSLHDRDKIQAVIDSDATDEEIRKFLLMSGTILSYMATTNIFSNAGDIDTEDIWKDTLNFSFYTCYCFQWTLFENFVKKTVSKLIDIGSVPQPVRAKLKERLGTTKNFLDYINSGGIFGESPFTTVLPVAGWIPQMERCDYSELDKIRKLRNDFIHGIETPEITSEDISAKQRRYERSMWILRKFAENIQHEVQKIINTQPSM